MAMSANYYSSPAYFRAEGKTNHDFARMINAYWGRDVVEVKQRTEEVRDASGHIEWTLTYRPVVSSVGPWPNGYPPK